MSTPSFTELGESIRKVLNSGYQYGQRVIKISLKTKSARDLEVDSSYNLNCENPEAEGDATVKLRLQDYGVLSEKWHSNGTINFEYKIDNKPLEGLGFAAGYSYNPSTNITGVQLTSKLKNDNVNLSCTISNSPDKNFNFLAGAVVGLRGLYVGYQFGYESSTNSFMKSHAGLTYKFPDVNLYFKCAPGVSDDYALSVVYKVNDNFKTAVSGTLIGLTAERNWTYACGVQYQLDQTSTLRMKFNRELQLDTSIQQLLYQGVKATLAFGVDLRDFTSSSHRVGLAIDLEA